MTDSLKVNFIFNKPNMAGGIKSCKLLAEEMQRQGADVHIYHPTTTAPQYFKRFKQLLKLELFKQLFASKELEKGQMSHHLESCSVPVVEVRGYKVNSNQVRDADFNIANFWMQREWIRDWPESKGIPGLYVRGHAVNETSTIEKLSAAYEAGGVLVTHANWLKKMLETKHKASDVILAPNGIDQSQFYYQPRTSKPTQIIGFQYHTDDRKGADLMLEAYTELLQTEPNLKLISYGSCDLAEKHKYVKNWSHEVRPSYTRIREIYTEATCWIIPSKSEGLPMPGLEASAVGTPVVATLCGGPEDYIEDGKSGFLIEIDDKEALKSRIKYMLDLDTSAWQDFSNASYKQSLNFNWERSAKHVISELTKIKNRSAVSGKV